MSLPYVSSGNTSILINNSLIAPKNTEKSFSKLQYIKKKQVERKKVRPIDQHQTVIDHSDLIDPSNRLHTDNVIYNEMEN